MKNLYKILVVAITVIFSVFTVSADRSLKVNVNNSSLVKMTLNYKEVELTNGENVFDAEALGTGASASVSLSTVQGSLFKSITNEKDVECCTWNSYYSLFISADGDYELDVTAVTLEEARTGQFTLNIDNPEKVNVVMGAPTYTMITDLISGSNIIKFIPDVENTFSITDKNRAPLYQVTVDGEDVTPNFNSYTINIKEDMIVDVKTDFPDEKVAVKFIFENDGEEFVTKVTVDGEEVDNYKSDDFTVQLGSKLIVYGNTTDYQFKSLKCSDGNDASYFYGSWDTYVLKPIDITIDAKKYESIFCTLEVDNPDAVTVRKGGANGTILSLTEGANEVEVTTKSPTLYFKANDGYLIESVTAGDVVGTETTPGIFTIPVTENSVIKVVTSKLVRDQKIVVYVQDMKNTFDVSLRDAQSVTWPLNIGYNLFEKAPSELTLLRLSVFGETNSREVYFNGEQYEPTYSGGSNFEFKNLVNGDVIKIYPYGVPDKCSVTFDVADDTPSFTAVHDIVAEFNPNDGLECFAGTLVTITPASDTDLKVSVNGTEISKGDDSEGYEFTVDENTTVTIAPSTQTSVSSIENSNAAQEIIYNLQGIKVNSTKHSLPEGIYIINGKKVVIK